MCSHSPTIRLSTTPRQDISRFQQATSTDTEKLNLKSDMLRCPHNQSTNSQFTLLNQCITKLPPRKLESMFKFPRSFMRNFYKDRTITKLLSQCMLHLCTTSQPTSLTKKSLLIIKLPMSPMQPCLSTMKQLTLLLTMRLCTVKFLIMSQSSIAK